MGYILKKKQIYQTLLLFNSALLEYFLDMRKYLSADQITGVYIYSERNFVHRCLQEEDSPGKGFLWGKFFKKKRGLAYFGVHSKKKTDISNVITIQFCIT